jgi:hypothetical protein
MPLKDAKIQVAFKDKIMTITLGSDSIQFDRGLIVKIMESENQRLETLFYQIAILLSARGFVMGATPEDQIKAVIEAESYKI